MLHQPPSPPPATSEKTSKRTGPELNARLSKTRLCRFVTSGRICPFGPSCTYAHSDAELVPSPNLTKTKVCWSNMYGRCARGSQCPYAHNEEELRRLPRLAIPLKSGAPFPPSSPYVVYYAADDPRGHPTVLQETKAVPLSGNASNALECPSRREVMGGTVGEYIAWSSDDDTVSNATSRQSSLLRQSSTESRPETVDTNSAVQVPGSRSGRTACGGAPYTPKDYHVEENSIISGEERVQIGTSYQQTLPDSLPSWSEQILNCSEQTQTALEPSQRRGCISGDACFLPPQTSLSDLLLDSQSPIKHSDIEWLLEEDRACLERVGCSLSGPAVHNLSGMQWEPSCAYNPSFLPKRDCETNSSALERPAYSLDDGRAREKKGQNTVGIVDFQATRNAHNPVVRWDGPLPDLRGDWLDRIKLRDCVSIS
ncbi:Zinc finger (CCCH type) protein, related [Neospora caninum Liverpool]|uniref:Zinc finger (CCCH type) protein, related n=1 Tax=Neospora caninum (strain Liverpool) TaxID=572307 RepID=F0VKJ0_NEOCL|nr:Zinc finger (CCCH type) protein, related [Neospora caninum Liverpool]CBZ54591.1 Zinc finger (CCCH type) protein, related [Neospora caninum Liverpool]CEL69305.1 TPA: Zinc finger (CCCH type) protein, related [Neospora caninum Liverpool]|eukprot:XP_003884621.1 Zinc finger (CCCH type) protein, related [Neospora caninum Liverpool]